MSRQITSCILFLVFLVLLGPVVSSAAQAESLDEAQQQEILARIQKRQAAISTILASFVEERHIAALANPLKFEGKVYITRQGFMFLRYLKPLQHIIKIDGDMVTFYVDGSPTADIINLAESQGRGAKPDLFNWTPENFHGTIRQTARGYLLDEKAERTGGKEITVLLDRDTLLAREISFVDEGGDRTIIILHNMTINEEIPASIINYSVPEGTKINKLNQ